MKKIFVIAVFVLLIATFVSAQVQVSGSNGADGTYTTLGAAFSAINANTQSGNNITITILGNTTETTTAVLNQGGWATLTIVPSGARTISGNIGGAPLIDLNGADNVTINGINSGGNSLTIVNNSTSNASGTSTIRLQTDATNNTITNCTILGSSTTTPTTNGGTIWIGANASTTGNDNNTISNNYIGPAGTNLPTKAIYGNGSTSTTAVYNTGIIISGNNIYDYFSASAASIGIYISGGNDN
ncbi:MAG: hypothetical protein RML33_08715 [Acidobacteriota bacterium]|nr:hypothetical protein [Pyrinomonadaceae bacterium]MDW8304898.1 hypothetical protein [Acidobacteriota bacterium]